MATNGGYWSLVGIIDQANSLLEEYESRPPYCCPNDGTPLLEANAGVIYCPWDGWHYDGRAHS